MRAFKGFLTGMLFLAGSVASVTGQDIKPIYHWSFDDIDNHTVRELISGVNDTIEGSYKIVPGVSGRSVRLDGFTFVARHKADKALAGQNTLSVEAWVALGAYPWNWCPVITQYKEVEGGFSFEIGPRGELGLRQMIGGNVLTCVSDTDIPLNTWTHIAATAESGKGIRLYINGVESGKLESPRKLSFSGNAETRIGMNYSDVYPAYRIGTEGGDTPYWFSIDGIIDEIKVFREVLPASTLLANYNRLLPAAKPDLPLRQLPRVTSTGKFKAYYEKLKYYEEWDEQWPVGADPDIVVTFADSPVKYIFWRGSRYSPAWVTDNHLWMADQSVETWNGPEGCLEHMQDRHCKYSHVRIIENTDARIVVHWRYAPVSAYDKLRLADEKTGWELWIDEYYYIYPDATAIRKVTWKTDHMCKPVQFQETLPFTEEGQLQGDVIEPDYLQVANLSGEKQQYDYVVDPSAGNSKKIPEKPNIQQHNFRSEYDPFIIFEPGNKMHYITDRDISNLSSPGSCNHWPVGQAYCDGRRVVAADRPTHFLGFPISYPVIHDGSDGRSWLNSLYGMKDASIDDLIVLGRSWAQAPGLSVINTPSLESKGYDRSEKIYRLAYDGPGRNRKASIRIDASEDSPLFNPSIMIENWGGTKGKVLVNGKPLDDGKDYRTGLIERLGGTHLVVWLNLRTTKTFTFEVAADQ
jgi:hypothetical protein